MLKRNRKSPKQSSINQTSGTNGKVLTKVSAFFDTLKLLTIKEIAPMQYSKIKSLNSTQTVACFKMKNEHEYLHRNKTFLLHHRSKSSSTLQKGGSILSCLVVRFINGVISSMHFSIQLLYVLLNVFTFNFTTTSRIPYEPLLAFRCFFFLALAGQTLLQFLAEALACANCKCACNHYGLFLLLNSDAILTNNLSDSSIVSLMLCMFRVPFPFEKMSLD